MVREEVERWSDGAAVEGSREKHRPASGRENIGSGVIYRKRNDRSPAGHTGMGCSIDGSPRQWLSFLIIENRMIQTSYFLSTFQQQKD